MLAGTTQSASCLSSSSESDGDGHALPDGGHCGRGLTRQVCQVKAHQRVHPHTCPPRGRPGSSQSGQTSPDRRSVLLPRLGRCAPTGEGGPRKRSRVVDCSLWLHMAPESQLRKSRNLQSHTSSCCTWLSWEDGRFGTTKAPGAEGRMSQRQPHQLA